MSHVHGWKNQPVPGKRVELGGKRSFCGDLRTVHLRQVGEGYGMKLGTQGSVGSL